MFASLDISSSMSSASCAGSRKPASACCQAEKQWLAFASKEAEDRLLSGRRAHDNHEMTSALQHVFPCHSFSLLGFWETFVKRDK